MRRLCSSFLLLLAIAPSASLAAQSDAARYLEAVKSNTPAALAFLRAMPKGGDLHSHLSGSIYA